MFRAIIPTLRLVVPLVGPTPIIGARKRGELISARRCSATLDLDPVPLVTIHSTRTGLLCSVFGAASPDTTSVLFYAPICRQRRRRRWRRQRRSQITLKPVPLDPPQCGRSRIRAPFSRQQHTSFSRQQFVAVSAATTAFRRGAGAARRF